MFQANRILKYLILVMLLLMTVAIGSFFFGGSSFRDSDVQLELESVAQASSGDSVTYIVKYRNNTKIDLKDVDFRFYYPAESVVINNGVPSIESTEGFKIEQLSPGESGQQEFSVFLVGSRGDIRNSRVTMTFKAGTLRSSFEKSASTSTTITSVPVSLTLVAPPNIISGQAISYILDYRNESNSDISGLRFEFNYPEGFTPQSYQPSPSQGNNVWDIATLKVGSGSRIVVQGILTGTENAAKNINLKLKRKVGDYYIDYQKASTNTIIANPLLNLKTTINGSNDYSANLGDNLVYRIQFSNTSNHNLFGMTLGVTLEGDMYDYSKINLGGGFFDDATKTVFWNASVYPDFASLNSGMQGLLQFSIPLKSQFTAALPGASRDRFVKATIKLSTTNVPQGVGGDEVTTTDTVITRITSQPTFNQFLYYVDPQFGSAGPFPPQSSQDTTFTVRWQLANPGNDISNAEVSAVLPPGVTWLNSSTVGQGQPQLSYNPNSSTVTWKLGNLPFGTGIYSPRYEAAFQVKIRPATSEKDKAIDIIKNASLTGVDSFTKQPIIVNGQKLDTITTVDRPGEGKVQ